VVIAVQQRLTDVELSLDDVGTGPPLVLIHGVATCRAEWRPFTAGWARDRRVVAYDQRGHGESTHLGQPERYSLDLLVKDLAELLDRRSVGPADLLGHSLGGVVAMKYALAYPDRVRSLVMVNASALPSAPPPGVVIRLAALARDRGMSGLAAIIDRMGDSAKTDPVRSRQFRENFGRTDVEAYQALCLELGSFPPMLDAARTLTVPVTILLGAGDELSRPDCAATVAAIPRAELVVIPDAAHSPQLENPEGWRRAVDAHLSRVEASSFPLVAGGSDARE
jgi:pimeloyl-ACP methyl ester carboxylesterase